MDDVFDTYLRHDLACRDCCSFRASKVDSWFFRGSERRITGWIGSSLCWVPNTSLSQLYTIVKRSAWIGFIKKVGGVRPWLTVHIALSFIGLVAVLLHAGFPYSYNSRNLLDHGLAGLTTWLLIASAASGVFGRYIYKRLPAMKKVFSYWKPSHLLITGLLFFAAVIHMTTAFGG